MHHKTDKFRWEVPTIVRLKRNGMINEEEDLKEAVHHLQRPGLGLEMRITFLAGTCCSSGWSHVFDISLFLYNCLIS